MNSQDAIARRRYFALILLAQIVIYGNLILAQRLPRGHDTLSVLILQYLFLAGPVSGGTGPLWIPYLTHGVTSTWLTDVQSSLLQNALLLTGGLPEGTPMLPVFYAGLFLEDLVLMIGTWRLSGMLYRSPSAQFFVTAAMVGSSLWVNNIFWAHRLIYGVPLAISLLLDFIETGNRSRLLLAASFGGLLLLGNALYIPVLSTMAIFLFIGLYLLIHRKRLRATRHLWRPRPSDAAWIAGILLLIGTAVIGVVSDLGSIRQYHRGRSPDGSVSLDSFLTYAGSLNPLKYLDFLFGLNASMDFSIYIGLCPLILAVVAVGRVPRKDLLVVTLSFLLLLMFSMGYLNGTAMLGYVAIPPLHYFRYVGLAAGLVKMFLILLSGFGVDGLVREARRAVPGGDRIGYAAAAGGLLLIQWAYLGIRSGGPPGTVDALFWAIRDNLLQRDGSTRFEILPGVLILAAGGGLLLAMHRRRPGVLALGIPLLLLIHGADLFRWRFQLLRQETIPLAEGQASMLKLHPLSFIERRSVISPDDPLLGSGGTFAIAGTRYDYGDALIRRDASWSPGIATHWSPYVDLLLRAHAGRPLSPDPQMPPPFVIPDASRRTQPESFARVIGESESKLQCFTAGHRVDTDEGIAAFMSRPDYQGNLLLLSLSSPGAGHPPDLGPASQNERLEASRRVLHFSADRLLLDVEIPADRQEAWLVYCDAWHPGWTATIDGIPEPIERANLAYKAVRLHAGRNRVDFRFRAPIRSVCYWLIGIQCLFWIVLVLGWTLRTLGFPRRLSPPEKGVEGGLPC